ncbi:MULTISPECIES: XkdW family protein [Bacillus]|uniref:XkdW family protein n=1 Tax=Bacillus TaxID=1386 RepID=UPI0002416477|nr:MULTISPECIES: XkdW family protein [Bacillus]COC35694.1 XkdW protein [Streptococcus pneumoniae]AGF28108.1 SPBc2 prophage-derived protein YomQ [Bacillus amyloliquefaciens IT-45]AJH23587.1 YomQ/XkdW protein, phage-like element PBSX [Bacillus velezensis]AKD21809.1 YomQ/XkdW protein, phage-like element PBSX [Bacillus velezensis]AKF30165.1 YomQ/XkdW protein, phage-like element PBSX [Bacillus velezensis]
MKLIFPYDNDNIYTGTPVELYPDSETGDYVMPPNAAGFPPEINGEGMWRPFFDEEKQEWVETADEAYKESLKKDTAPDSNQLAGLGGQLANEKLARKAAEQAQQSLGRQLASLKLELLNVKGE